MGALQKNCIDFATNGSDSAGKHCPQNGRFRTGAKSESRKSADGVEVFCLNYEHHLIRVLTVV